MVSISNIHIQIILVYLKRESTEMIYINQLTQSMKKSIQDKMIKINQQREKYKRSTNNSHKKFICVARKLLYKLSTTRERELFQKEFQLHQNCRVYYFIILAHVKLRMSQSERESYQRNLTTLLQAKKHTYNQQIQKTNNKNFINFRFEEIADLQYALKALSLYLQDHVQDAIKIIYKKQKEYVLKRNQYEMALQIVNSLQERLKSYPEGPLFPYLNESIEKTKNKQKISNKIQRVYDEQEQINKYSNEYENRKQINNISIDQDKDNKYPLLFLQESYPLYTNFYPIVFNYQKFKINHQKNNKIQKNNNKSNKLQKQLQLKNKKKSSFNLLMIKNQHDQGQYFIQSEPQPINTKNLIKLPPTGIQPTS